MPLNKGSSNKVRDANIKELIQGFESAGEINGHKPTSKKKAVDQAVAIGYAQQRRGRRKGK